ncbi:MAG: FliM/FliN family flagellar motor switch protein [Francisellaceae bacterium]
MTIETLELTEYNENQGKGEPIFKNLEILNDVNVSLSAQIGTAKINIGELLAAKKGKTIKLDQHIDAPIELYLHGKCIAKGMLVAVDDNFGIEITELA